MTDKHGPPFLLFYPTSPIHVRDMQLLIKQLPHYQCVAIAHRPLERIAPGIHAALQQHGMNCIDVDDHASLDRVLPANTAVVALGAVFEVFALELFAWAKLREIAVIAIEEVAQLALNQFDINNYDAPFDRLFAASEEERRGFIDLGYSAEMLVVSGLLANDRGSAPCDNKNEKLINSLGVALGQQPILYTTSPLRNRLALHNKDDVGLRRAILGQLAEVNRNTGRPIIIKLHPNENIEDARGIVHEVLPKAILIGRDVGLDEILPHVSALVNRGNSQTCLDAALSGVPVIVAACGLTTLFHTDGGAFIVESVGDLANCVIDALSRGPIDNSTIKAKHFFQPAEGVASFIAREIGELGKKKWPMSESSWNWLISSMLFLGRHDRALALCEKICSRSPWQELVRRALENHSAHRIQDAISAWLECTVLHPRWYFPHYELAHGYLALGQTDRAILHASKAMELHPPFHSLWHELPMRVVIMRAHRSWGDLTAASKQLKDLESRGLVEIVPELLIEAAALHSAYNEIEAAVSRLEDAAVILRTHPVDQVGDSNISERGAKQCVEVAGKYAELGVSARSIACLARAMEFVGAHPTVRPYLAGLLEKFGEQRETAGDYIVAEQCYMLGVQADSTAHWIRYRLSRIALEQGAIRKAIHQLFTIARIPGAPKDIIERALSPAGAARLARFWAQSPRSIVKPLLLCALMTGWCSLRLLRPWRHDFYASVAASLIVWFYVARHFVRRLRLEGTRLRKLFYWPKSFLSCLLSAKRRAIICPICGATGRFEHQNKVTPLFRCRQCNHVYARDLPDDRELNRLYGDFGYWERDRYHQGITAIQEGDQWHEYLNARIGILQKLELLENAARPTRTIFEIGCAEGMLLHELRKRGMEVMGCEMNRAVALEGMKQLGINILTEPFERIELPTNYFDLVMSFHTVEHLRDPAAVIAKVATILRPDGVLLVEVPCGPEEYDNTDHLHFFSDTSLRWLLLKYFRTAEILDNSYTNSAGVRTGSLYGVGRAVRHGPEQQRDSF